MIWLIVIAAVAFLLGRHTRFSNSDDPKPIIQVDAPQLEERNDE